MEKVTTPINILELNNLDVYGKRFNGFILQEYSHEHSQSPFNISMLVNHKLSNSPNVKKIFPNKSLENFDWQIDDIENRLGTKNQISVTEEALINHPLYKKANILHFHMYHNMHLPIEFLTRIPPEKKIILDLHDTFWLTDKNIPMLEVFKESNLNKDSLDAERKRVLESIDAHFVLHSPYMLNLFKKSTNIPKTNVTQINFSIDTNVFKPLPCTSKLRKKYSIPENDVVLLFRAQKEFKGLSYIIAALKSIPNHHNISLITVGGEGFVDELKSEYNVHDFGLIDDENEMTKIYNLCDIFLAPSTEESFGFMAVEAMACGKPVIVFEGTALPDTIHAPNIGIATKRNSKSLADAIVKLVSSEDERIERGNASLAFVKKTYNTTKYLEQTLNLYRTLSNIPKRSVISLPARAQNKSRPDYAKLTSAYKYIVEEQFDFIKPIVIDYNNQKVQKTLFSLNQKLYSTIKDSPPPSSKGHLPRRIASKIYHKLKKVSRHGK